MTTLQPADPEIRCRRKDGSNYWASLFISPVHDKDGIIVQYFASLIDVTKYREHLETEARMQELQSELFHMSRSMIMGEMAENLAHELNQPLSAIVNYLKGSYRILECMEGPQVPMLREAFKGAERAGPARWVRNPTPARVRGPRRKRARTSRSFRGLSRRPLTLPCWESRISGIEVTFDFAHRKALVLVNRTQIQQVLLNLIRNAVEAMDHAGQSKLVIKTKDVLVGTTGSSECRGYRSRHRASGPRQTVYAFYVDKKNRNGGRTFHLPEDHRGSWWQALGTLTAWDG